MSTPVNILLTAVAAAPQDEKGTNFSNAQDSLVKEFEAVMAHLLSGPANKGAPNGLDNQFQKPADSSSGKTPLSAAQPIGFPAKSTSKSVPASTGGNSKKDVNSATGAETVPIINPDLATNPLLTMVVANAEGDLAPAIASRTPGFHAGTTSTMAVSAPTLPQPKSTSVVTKILASDLAENEAGLATPSLSLEKAGGVNGRETVEPVKESDAFPPGNAPAINSAVIKIPAQMEDHSASKANPDSTPAQLSSTGTSIAKQDMEMQQAPKTNYIAGQTEKVLPGDVIPMLKAKPSLVLPDSSPSASAVNLNSTFAGTGETTVSLRSTSIPGQAAADIHTRLLERTQDMVTLNASRITESGNNSMQVVIKPDAGTQLSLELRKEGGTVQVQAVLQQGDFNHLSRQWPELQQRLGRCGIDLTPLAADGSSANSSGYEQFQSKQNQPTEAVPDLPLAGSPAHTFVPEPAQAPAHRGWETWA